MAWLTLQGQDMKRAIKYMIETATLQLRLNGNLMTASNL